ncbi:MAG TPA: ABC transporter ATP-binding protein [Ornithinimicrobium sp.]|uniref:ABC transporter ATP-binding protein n=1 Tax=Ornithinimicrobium sp. TaxID=1977084 RepID=UPI002B47692E|nr:ABC transporter ATP-binding protein [Ornithinimicrobium sp.]HKJ11330.1 ABC transporter ATP-binding protein [Ornithinimicrobium sp.]
MGEQGRDQTPPLGLPRAQLREMWPYLREHRVALAVVAVLSICATFFAVVQPLMLQRLVNSVGAGEAVGGFLALLIGVTLAQALFSGLQTYYLESTAERVVLGVRRRLVGSLLSLPVKVFDTRRVGDLLSRVGSDTTLLRSVVTSGLFEVVSSTLMFIAAVVLMVLIDPLLFAVTLATVLTGVLAVFLLARRVRVASKEAQTAVGAMSSSVERALSGIRTIKAAVAEEREAALIDADATAAYRAGLRLAMLSAVIQPVVTISLQAAFLVVLAVGGVRVANGSMQLGDLMAFILYLFLLIMPIGSAVGAFVQIQTGLAALDRIQEVVRWEAETADESALDAAPMPADRTPVIEFKGVSFHYPRSDPHGEGDQPGSGPTVLDDVSFAVPRGARIALVGPSGSGKSTTLALVERFYEPTSGQITVAGTPLDTVPRSELRARLGLIEQDAPVLSGTLADNLRLAAPEASEAELVRALTSVGLAELVDRESGGLALDLGEHGTKLSGGQRQRLAWARTMLAGREVLLMDEPTSSVDSRTEHQLQATLAELAQRRTVLVVAHRLSTVRDFDRILVLEHGRLVAEGTHAELIADEGVYREMAFRQGLVGTATPETERTGVTGMQR